MFKKILLIFCLFYLVSGFSLVAQVKVACIGDSITEGMGLANPSVDSYPARLGVLLSSGMLKSQDIQVRNFGVSGRTLLNNGDHPYYKEQAYQDALAWKPDIVIIVLGTNDAKKQNICQFPDEFIPDYRTLIQSFRNANSVAKIFLCIPPPLASAEAMNINADLLEKTIDPMIRQVSETENTKLIDLYIPLKKHPEYFPDKVHPNKDGALLMAKIVFRAIVDEK